MLWNKRWHNFLFLVNQTPSRKRNFYEGCNLKLFCSFRVMLKQSLILYVQFLCAHIIWGAIKVIQIVTTTPNIDVYILYWIMSSKLTKCTLSIIFVASLLIIQVDWHLWVFTILIMNTIANYFNVMYIYIVCFNKYTINDGSCYIYVPYFFQGLSEVKRINIRPIEAFTL